MNSPDLITGLFELVAGIAIWLNVKEVYEAKEVRGVNWFSMAFFTLWGYWNLWYFPHLNQWFAFAGGIAPVTGNTVWCYLAWKYNRKSGF